MAGSSPQIERYARMNGGGCLAELKPDILEIERTLSRIDVLLRCLPVAGGEFAEVSRPPACAAAHRDPRAQTLGLALEPQPAREV
jgi:hypothetical protein